MDKYTILDIETTGLKCNEGAEITEIAGINVVNNEVMTTYSALINIKGEINDFIKNLTGITTEMCNNGQSFETVFYNFMNCLDITKDTNLVIYNKSFDFNFILYWVVKYNIENEYYNRFINCNCECALELAREVLPDLKSHKLEYLKEYFKIKSKSHRALNDCLVTKKVYQKLCSIKLLKNNER